jgi:NAD-dependent dihydropyrimidine dehydrogenase PreA subunit
MNSDDDRAADDVKTAEPQVPAGAFKDTKAWLVANPITPCRAIVVDPELCIGCNRCVDVCRSDVLMPNVEKGGAPLLAYPDECWFCACCVEHCPIPGAIKMEQPLNQRVGWKRKATGEYFRIGMKNPPPPNNRPPVGGWGLWRRRPTTGTPASGVTNADSADEDMRS